MGAIFNLKYAFTYKSIFVFFQVLCHPSSVDSLSTSAAQEDHVSMGGMSARKALAVVKNVERVLAIELLAAVQALEFSAPLKTTAPLERVHEVLRTKVAPWTEDRYMAPDIDAAVVQTSHPNPIPTHPYPLP